MVCTPHSIMVGWFGKFILPTFSITTQSLTINFESLSFNFVETIVEPSADQEQAQQFFNLSLLKLWRTLHLE